MNHPTPERTILEVWSQGTSERGNKVWTHSDSYEGGLPADVKRTANNHYRDSRNEFVFPAYLIRDADTREPIWCTSADSTWQPKWISVREAITNPAPHVRLFFRPPLPGVGAALICRESVDPALLVGVSGERLETIHVLVNGKVLVLDGRNHFWSRFGFVKGPSIPQSLRFAVYQGDAVWLDMWRAGSFSALLDQITRSISTGDYLLRKANNFVSPGKLAHLTVERYNPRPPPRFKLKPTAPPPAKNASANTPAKRRRKRGKTVSPSQPPLLDSAPTPDNP